MQIGYQATKKLNKPENNRTISFRMDKHLIERVNALTVKAKITTSDLLRHFIIRGVEAMERQQ
jgi:predicted DNA-binding protein